MSIYGTYWSGLDLSTQTRLSTVIHAVEGACAAMGAPADPAQHVAAPGDDAATFDAWLDDYSRRAAIAGCPDVMTLVGRNADTLPNDPSWGNIAQRFAAGGAPARVVDAVRAVGSAYDSLSMDPDALGHVKAWWAHRGDSYRVNQVPDVSATATAAGATPARPGGGGGWLLLAILAAVAASRRH